MVVLNDLKAKGAGKGKDLLNLNHSIRKKAIDLLNSGNINIMNQPSFIKKFLNQKKVTVVTPSYNAENYIEKTINSVLKQSIGFENIQYIIVDDCSTDNTAQIIKNYAHRYKNICAVFLDKNTGSPGTPRNIGIELAQSKYITFLDADDWLSLGGLQHLYNILEETKDDHIVGKTVKIKSSKEKIAGEHESVKERRNISPFDLPQLFYSMGPRARMIKLSIIRKHKLGFPDFKFAEDKFFFFDYLLNSKAVSTTTKPVYFVNRVQENTSLTRFVNVLEKRKYDLAVIKHVLSKQLPIEKEKVLLTRIYEYDFIRTLNSQTFIKSKDKKNFFKILSDAFELTNILSYNIIECFHKPIFQVAASLFIENRTDDLIRLMKWYRNDSNKKYVIQDNIAYMEAPFLNDKYKFIKVPMFARFINAYVMDNKYHLIFEIYGDHINELNDVIIRDRNRASDDFKCNIELTGNNGKIEIDIGELDKLRNSLYTIFVRYGDYQLINIKQIARNNISYNKRQFDFYATRANNLGLSIEQKK